VRKKEKGSILVLTLVLMVMLLFLAGVLLQLTLLNYMHITISSESEQAFWIAKAGLSEAKYYVVKNWFDPELDPDKNNGYNGIVSICKGLAKGKNFGTNSDGTASGSYKVGISPINGPGVHEIIIASEGITVPIEKYKRLDEYLPEERTDGFRVSLILRLRMDSPTDYLFFWNGDSGMKMDSNWIIGPVYANGSFFVAVGKDAPSTSGYVINHSYFLKSETLKGPAIHCNGTFWVPYPFEGDVRVGEGVVKWGAADWTGIPTDQHYFTHNTDSNAVPAAFQYNDLIITNNNYYYPNFDYYQPVPTQSTPNVTFDVQQLDGKTRHLLQDKFHGAYNIYCPTKDEVYGVFNRYIDENFHIKSTKSTSIPGGKVGGFYNMAAKRKTPFPFVNHGEEVVSFLQHGKIGGLATFPTVLNPMVDYDFAYYNPFAYATCKNLSVGGWNVNNDDYQIISGESFWWSNPSIIFRPGFNLGAGSPVKANKCHMLYGTNDTTNYFPDAQISSVNWDIIGGTVVMKNFISNEIPLDAEYGWGRFYQTASFMNPGGIAATVIDTYDYSPTPGNEYGFRNRHWLSKYNGMPFGTGWREDITTSPIPVTGPKDGYGADMSPQWGVNGISSSGFDSRWSDWEVRAPAKGIAEYEPHCGIIKAGGGAQINLRPMIRNTVTGVNPTGWGHTTHGGAVYWYGVPEMGCISDPVAYTATANVHYQPLAAAGAYVNFFKTDTATVSHVGEKAVVNYLGVPQGWWHGGAWVKADGTTFSDFPGVGIPAIGGPGGAFAWEVSYTLEGGGNHEIDYGSIQFINSDPQSIGIQDVTVTYTSNRKEIISVSGAINNPYKVVCTDQWVDYVGLYLSQLDEDNWPKYGLIFAEVPLFITGVPKKKITIVSTKDVYLGSINYSYWNNASAWVPCPYVMGDERANPVAVISAGQVYISFQENTNKDLYPASEIMRSQGTNSKLVVRNLNKVIFYSQTDNLFYCDGTPNNHSYIYGSAVLGRKTGLIAGKNDTFNTVNVLDSDSTRAPFSRFANFGMGGDAGLLGSNSARAYEESFRYNLPACIPKTIKSMDYAEGDVSKMETMLKELEVLLGTLDETNPQIKRKGLTAIDDSKWEEIGNTILAE